MEEALRDVQNQMRRAASQADIDALRLTVNRKADQAAVDAMAVAHAQAISEHIVRSGFSSSTPHAGGGAGPSDGLQAGPSSSSPVIASSMSHLRETFPMARWVRMHFAVLSIGDLFFANSRNRLE